MTPRRTRALRIVGAAMATTLLLSSAAMASHHEAGETVPESEPAKILQATPDDHVMLVGGSRVITIEICNADGTNCKPANKARTTFRPKSGLQRSGNKGSQIKVTGKQPGTYTLAFKQGQVTGETTVTVNEPPNREPQEPTGDMPRLYLIPSERIVQVGEFAGFEAVGCTLVEGGRFGPNGIPDGVDDECAAVPINAVAVSELPDVSIVGPLGSRFGLLIEEFPPDAEGPRLFVGPQVVTDIGSTVASMLLEDVVFDPAGVPDPPATSPVITASDDAAGELQAFRDSGRPLGDANGNGTYDEEDPAMAHNTFTLGVYDAALDYDEDGDLDLADWEAGGWGGTMPTPLAPFGAPAGE